MAFIPDAQQPQQLEVISPHEATLRQQTGFTADGHPAPPAALVDTQPGSPAAPRATRFVPDAPPKPDVIGEANRAAEASEHGSVQDVVNMLKAVPGGIVNFLNSIGQNAVEHPILGNIPALADTFRRVAADPSGTLTSVSNAVQNATPEQVGRNVIAPFVAGGAAGEGVGLASRAAAGAGALDEAGQLGLRTANGVGTKLAGETTGPTLDAQNQRVASSILGADAGVPHSSPVNASTLEDARAAPGEVLDAGYSQVPTGPLSPAARQQVLAARGAPTITKPTPNVANSINDIESSLVDPNGQFTGEQLRATRNSLNSDATAGADSDDADTRAIAAYKRKVVSALDQHVQDTMLPNSTVTPEQVSNARATLGKNYQLQDLIGKGGDIDLQKLAKLHRDNPNLLTGNTRTVAQFASDHPEVTGAVSNADRISPPSFLGDVANVNLLQRPVGSVGQALFGSLGRRLLRGAPGEAIGRAMGAPVAGLGGEFDVGPPSGLNLQAPPGAVGNAPIQRTMNLEPGSGQIPPGSGPQPPTQVPPAIAARVEPQPPLSTQDWLDNFMHGDNSDYSHVMSQGVPEGIVQRGGNDPASLMAASPEAISRGTRDLAIINPDGNEQPLLRDVTQIDQKPPKGSMIIDRSTGEIINRGGLSAARAAGLRNRWATMGRTLGDHFTMGPADG